MKLAGLYEAGVDVRAGDAGEAKELGAYANRLNLPMAIVDKRRFGNDEKPKLKKKKSSKSLDSPKKRSSKVNVKDAIAEDKRIVDEDLAAAKPALDAAADALNAITKKDIVMLNSMKKYLL